MDEAVLSLLNLLVSSLLLAYWLTVYNYQSPQNSELVRDICYLMASPNGTSISGDYHLNVCIVNGTLASRTPIDKMCLVRVNTTAVTGFLYAEDGDKCFEGKVRLRLTKVGGKVAVGFDRS
ncbi:hypothetical protein IG193_04325 [Infirmifilum lucidum]|uniref:Uncharacterized protein n=1 Tax=Infirmifilum lucidum TaxID=2776706 RepID=A0A7L9FLD3_9CREN|nr:hypothetical protein [Infirmifilum lucidum]QOJ79686.1 hypothetical protein IG193_04325 [Infirmifilum lucidum]